MVRLTGPLGMDFPVGYRLAEEELEPPAPLEEP
jgi:hypothetical protein